MTNAELELWARIVVLQAWLQRDPTMRFRQASDRPSGAEAIRNDVIEIAKTIALPRKLSAADRRKLDGKIDRAIDQMLEGIPPRLG